jgi:hypothetical protein
LVLTDSSVNIFGDHTGRTFIFNTFEALLQIRLKNQKYPWLKVSKEDSRKLLLVLSMSHLFYNFKKNREASKIWENGILGTPLERLKMENFIHFMMLF